MPRILIAGCGYLGQAVAELFVSSGWEVEGWTGSAESAMKAQTKSFAVQAVDIAETQQVHDAARKQFDYVVHCASTRGGDVDLYRRVYLTGTRNLLDAFPGATILFTSSTSVYAQKNGEWVTEESETAPAHAGGRVLLEAEQLVGDRNGIVARLAGIYGPGRSALLWKFLNGASVSTSSPDRFVNQIHRDDAAAALFLLLNRRVRSAAIYNAVDDEPILLSQCYRWLGERLQRDPNRTEKSKSVRRRGQSNKRVSNAKLRALGWIPQFATFAAGMEKSVLPAEGLRWI